MKLGTKFAFVHIFVIRHTTAAQNIYYRTVIAHKIESFQFAMKFGTY